MDVSANLSHAQHAQGLFRAEYGHLINNEWVGSTSGETIEVFNPATGAVISRIQSGNAQDAVRAVDAAAAAFGSWSQTNPAERQAILHEMGRRLQARAMDYAMMETLDNGKPIMEALHFDLPAAIEQFQLFAGASWNIHGQSLETRDALGIVLRQPIGVCVQIIPWNVPLVMMAAKIAPALAAGNTIVLKPAETVCLAVLEFAREVADLLPPGVLNVITGYGARVGEALVTHPKVRKLAFTGSPATARTLMGYAAANIIPQTLELGGKSANIVCDDADLDAAAEGAAMSVVVNKGEICLAGSRLFVHDKIYDDFLDRFTGILSRIRVGDPMDRATQLGAQASPAQMKKVLGYIDLGREEGAKVTSGGGRASVAGFEDGLFLQPTVFVDANNDMRIAREEIFGPVSVVIRWNDESDVLRMANDSVYGLGGGLWTRNLARAHRMARQMETGTVWVNRYYNMMANMPVGGVKQSGFGREFAHEVLNHYTVLKSVIISMNEGKLGVFDH